MNLPIFDAADAFGPVPAGGPALSPLRARPLATTAIADIVSRLRARAEAAGVRCLAAPPLSPGRIAQIERDVGGLPAELAELLAVTAGLHFGPHALDFAASFHITEMPPLAHSPWRLFPKRLDLGTGADGGRYIVDLARPHLPTAPVFGLWPNPPVIKLLATSLAEFLANVARTMPAKGEGSEWDFAPLGGGYKSQSASRRQLGDVAPVLFGWRLRQLADPVLSAYAANLPRRTGIVDLRSMACSTIEWAGRWRVSEFHRHPSEPIFGMTIARQWWRPTAWLLGRPSGRERRRWLAAFKLE